MISPNLRRRAAEMWLNLLFRHAEHAPAIARAIQPFIVRGVWMASPSIRRGTRANMARLLGRGASSRQRDSLAREVVGNFYGTVVEFGRNRRRTAADLIALLDTVEGERRYLEARRDARGGRGAILVTAHLGSFEVAMAMLRVREPRVHVVFRRDEFPLFERLRAAQHAKLGVIEAPADDGLLNWARLRDALAADEVVLMQADRVLRDQPGIVVPFLGGHARVPSGPAKLARLSGAPLIPVFAVNTPGRRVRIQIGEPIWTQDFPLHPGGRGTSGTATIDPVVVRVTAAIERVIRENPSQWLRLDAAVLEDELNSSRPSHDRSDAEHRSNLAPAPPIADRRHGHGAGDIARPHA